MQPNGNGRTFTLFHLLTGIIVTAIAVIGLSRGILSDRVSVEGEVEFRKRVDARLDKLEVSDKELSNDLKKHLADDVLLDRSRTASAEERDLKLADHEARLKLLEVKRGALRGGIYRNGVDGVVVRFAKGFR